jgi:hypothetical protein
MMGTHWEQGKLFVTIFDLKANEKGANRGTWSKDGTSIMFRSNPKMTMKP